MTDGSTKWHILVIEDDKKLLDLYKLQVKALSGDTIELFSDPVQAMYRFQNRQSSIDLIVTDQNMPCFGSDLIKQIRHEKPTQRIAIVTGVRSIHLGPDLKDIKVFQKPANLADVISEIKKAA